MIAALEEKLHRWRRRLSRSEWAIRHLGFTPLTGTGEQPGLLLVQIDGFPRGELEAAIDRGRMPFLRRLMRRDGYNVHTFYSGLPATTPAVQAELYYGVKSGVPAFSFFDRTKNKIGRMFDPAWAKEYEARFQAAGHEGLLKDGSSWSNIYTGGAQQSESHFCGASIGLGDMWRTGKIRNIFIFILLQFPAVVRIAGRLLVNTCVALCDAFDGIRHGEPWGLELNMAISRIFIGTGLRELITIGAKIDLARGLPVIHVNFLAYDEQAHRRGPSSRFARWALRPLDRAIKDLYRHAQLSSRRDYAVWIFSDHGQESTQTFSSKVPGGIEAILQAGLEEYRAGTHAKPVQSRSRPALRARRGAKPPRALNQEFARRGAVQASGDKPFVVTALGPLGHVYFREACPPSLRTLLAQRLVQAGVPGVIANGEEPTWFHAKGETRVPRAVAALLPHPAALKAEIARDVAGLCANPESGELILLAWSPWDLPQSFSPERGAHGGFGPGETQGFALLPPRTRLPAGTRDFIRPAALRNAALALLRRGPLATSSREVSPGASLPPAVTFRVMTYNVHGCSGMDGRISPRRIARVIGDHAPDIVALQEIDHGRHRSRAEDQGKLIAEELGMHFLFCPTVMKGSEHYGHMVLSRWPLELVKRAVLPSAPGGWWPEPRAALWARVRVEDRNVHVVTTHLGLSPRERKLQMEALLGDEWIGSIPADEPVILCGDFNHTPRSVPYALASKKMRDVQRGVPGHKPKFTFTSARPFTRLDYIFVSPALEPRRASVPRNQLTRLASDHLPLVVELQAVSGANATKGRSIPG